MKVRASAFAVALSVVLAILPSAAHASDPQSFGMLGPSYRADVTASPQPATADRVAVRGNLGYHGGPILKQSTTHPIFWGTFDPSYVSGVEQYFTDVASDSGHQTNVYSVGTQYFDKRRDGTIRNHANYDVVAGAPIMDADPYPANACPPPTGYTNCLSDRQIELEIQHLVNSQHLAKGRNSIYFMFLPAGIDSCFGRRICADNYFCAYHSGFVANSGGIILYTNQPFANLPDGGCDASGTPNGADLDDVLNVVSHEHNETITDPLGNAWYARDGEENGDKCNFRFDNPGAQNYNQTINGHNYELQEEWSNHSRTCLPYGH